MLASGSSDTGFPAAAQTSAWGVPHRAVAAKGLRSDGTERSAMYGTDEPAGATVTVSRVSMDGPRATQKYLPSSDRAHSIAVCSKPDAAATLASIESIEVSLVA